MPIATDVFFRGARFSGGGVSFRGATIWADGRPATRWGFDVRYVLEVAGEPVIIAYMVMRDAKETRVPVLVWFH
ncbi:hypothetical protein ACFYWN_43420 [Streptomyces sp. NPDC002917]|uniref:hypothetical protein n=1 Tax=Streptomyces sp. NPDC002917 TaxID=3364671 RepID=UPI003699B3CB